MASKNRTGLYVAVDYGECNKLLMCRTVDCQLLTGSDVRHSTAVHARATLVYSRGQAKPTKKYRSYMIAEIFIYNDVH